MTSGNNTIVISGGTATDWSALLEKHIALAKMQKPHYETGTDVKMEITVEHHRQHAPAKVMKPCPECFAIEGFCFMSRSGRRSKAVISNR